MRRCVCALSLLLSLAGFRAGTAPAVQPSAGRQGATTSGVTFMIPAAWTVERRLWLSVLRPPESDLRVAIVEVGSALGAVIAAGAAWALYRSDDLRRVIQVPERAPRHGWDEEQRLYLQYATGEHREAFALAYRRATHWSVVILDGNETTAQKRRAEVNLILQSVRPAGP